jgi:PAS domain S-box-containing protein
MLTSRFAMWMGWGEDLTFFYNDAYRPTLGDKHAWALGSTAREVWQEIWPDIGPRINHVLETGNATWDEALLLFLERSGYPEETYHTFSYSPLADDDGAIVGMLCVVSEETERIIEERRLTCLNGLASDIARTNTRSDLMAAVKRQFDDDSKDLPFTLTYLFDETGRANLACATGVAPGHAIAPPVIEASDPDPFWPVGALRSDRMLLTVGDLSQRFGAVPTGGWDVPPREAVVAPIVRQGHGSLAGFLVAAINPCRPPGETNLRFIKLVAGQLASGLANADACAEARRRAEALAEIDRVKTTFSNVSHEFRTPLGPLEELISGAACGDPEASQAPAGTTAQAYVEEALRWLPDQPAALPGPSETLSPSSVEDRGGQPAPLAGHRVLMADDNADMRDYVRRLLAEQGYAVEAVADGEAALAAAKRHKPDLVLSDVMMPRLDGFGLVQALRHDPALREVPIILLSARAGEDALADGIEGGADDYLTKPFAARELLGRVRANLRMTQLRSDAVEALRTRTTELETVLATVPAAVWFTSGPDGGQITGNRQASALLRLPMGENMSLGGPNAEAPGRRVFSGGRELTSDTIPLHRALRGEKIQGEELEVRFDDGKTLTVVAYAAPLCDAAGGIVGAVCAGIDISSRKVSEDRFRRVVEASPSAMVMIGARGQIELVNTQAERVFGYGRQELLGQNIEILLPKRYRKHHPGLRTGYFADPVARPMGAGRDLFGRKKDGTEFPIEIGLSPIETEEGPMILSAVVDLSERVDAAKALAQSEAEFRASFEAAAVGKILSDPVSRRIVRANRAFANMLGYEPEALTGRTCPEFTWHEDAALDAADFARLRANTDDTVVREMRYVRRDGTPFWARTSATIARTGAGDDRGLVVRAVEDIDTRYRAEAALVEAKQALEQVVEQRTDALGQRDLLLREVYHRVKNNLQLIDSLLMMQRRRIVDPEAKDALLSLRGRIHALGLVHQQLMGSADLKTFDVVPFLEELSTNLMDSAGMGGVNISTEADALDIGLDLAIPLGLLVTELVTNSLKHAFPQGNGTISIILRRDSRQHMTLIVADNGIGHAVNETADSPRSGLGTRIIARLVEQLEGQMTIQNETGSRTEIRFVMPGQS